LTKETVFPENDWRSIYFCKENLIPTVERVEKLKKDVPAGMTLPEMALRFVLSHPVVSTTIVGMRRLVHVRQNIGMSDAGGLDAGLLAVLKGHRWDRRPTKWSQ